MSFLRYASGQTDRQTDRHADRNTSHPSREQSSVVSSVISVVIFSVTVSVTVIFLVSIQVAVILFQLLLQLQLSTISINCTNNEGKCFNKVTSHHTAPMTRCTKVQFTCTFTVNACSLLQKTHKIKYNISD